MTYIDQLKYNEYSSDSDNYISDAKIENFDIIQSQYLGDARKNSGKFYQTVETHILKNMPEEVQEKAVSACLRTERNDVFVPKKLLLITLGSFLNKVNI